jgi:hypothetical protein
VAQPLPVSITTWLGLYTLQDHKLWVLALPVPKSVDLNFSGNINSNTIYFNKKKIISLTSEPFERPVEVTAAVET